MKNLILSIAILLSAVGYAQYDEDYLDGLVSKFTSSLESRNINTYLSTKRACTGNIRIFDMGNGKMCSSKSTYFEVYVFWLEGEKSMIKKIDNCGMYTSLELKDNSVLSYIDRNKEEIKSNPIKPYKIASKDSGPILRTEIHSCSRVIAYQNEEGFKIDQSYHLFDLSNDALEENLNYKYNNGLKVLKLENMMTDEIAIKEDLFRRQATL